VIRRRQVLRERHAGNARLRGHPPAKLFERGGQPRVTLERGSIGIRAAIDWVIPFDLHGEVLFVCESGIEVLDATN
jgi:hypothetical protein